MPALTAGAICKFDLSLFFSRLIASEATTGRNQTFLDSLAANQDLGAIRGIDAALKLHDLDALVLPATGKSTTPAGMSPHRLQARF